MFVARLFVITVLTLSAASCGKLTLSIPQASSVIDFLKTEIIVGGSNLADGVAEMIVRR